MPDIGFISLTQRNGSIELKIRRLNVDVDDIISVTLDEYKELVFVTPEYFFIQDTTPNTVSAGVVPTRNTVSAAVVPSQSGSFLVKDVTTSRIGAQSPGYPIQNESFSTQNEIFPTQSGVFPIQIDCSPPQNDRSPTQKKRLTIQDDSYPIQIESLPVQSESTPVQSEGFSLHNNVFFAPRIEGEAVAKDEVEDHFAEIAMDQGRRNSVGECSSFNSTFDRETGPADTPNWSAFAVQLQCAFCGKMFRKKWNLVEHVRTHTGERPFACNFPDCHYSAATSGNLKVHKRKRHSGERRFVCNYDNCTASFTESCELKVHLRIHTGERPYRCDFPGCGYSAIRAGAVSSHRWIHAMKQQQLTALNQDDFTTQSISTNLPPALKMDVTATSIS